MCQDLWQKSHSYTPSSHSKTGICRYSMTTRVSTLCLENIRVWQTHTHTHAHTRTHNWTLCCTYRKTAYTLIWQNRNVRLYCPNKGLYFAVKQWTAEIINSDDTLHWVIVTRDGKRFIHYSSRPPYSNRTNIRYKSNKYRETLKEKLYPWTKYIHTLRVYTYIQGDSMWSINI